MIIMMILCRKKMSKFFILDLCLNSALCWLIFVTMMCSFLVQCVPSPKQAANRSHKFGYTAFEESDPRHWYSMAKADIHERLTIHRPIHHRARNVILFLGDGMGISTITASRILKGQLKGERGEEGYLEFDRFPHSALIKTYNVNKQVPDSAGTATAYLTGVKANFYTLGVSAKVDQNTLDCDLVKKSSVSSILQWAIDADKAAGIVTTTRITHATPGAGYAHTQNRDWEANVPEEAKGPCKDIARQLIEDHPGSSLNVLLGGGRANFLPNTVRDPKGQLRNGKLEPVYGQRKDGRNLLEEWKLNRKAQAGLNSDEFIYVNSSETLKAVDFKKTKYLFGLFNHTNLEYEQLRDKSPSGEPSLTEMTEAAIRVLSNNENGFVLLVEGGRIDHAHHDGYANLALHETVEFDRAIRRARELVSLEDTLILVTADHSHTLTINGYPTRGNPIQGFAGTDNNGIPFNTLMYTNGPGHKSDDQRENMNLDDYMTYKYRVHSGVPLREAHHGGEDVALFSIGPMAHLFGGTHEQSYIAHVIGFASCIGQYRWEHHCTSSTEMDHETIAPIHNDKYDHNKHKSKFMSYQSRSFNSATAARTISKNIYQISIPSIVQLIIILAPLVSTNLFLTLF